MPTPTIIVETGAGVTGANSYVSAADAVTYAANRSVALLTPEILAIKAMDYIETRLYQGSRKYQEPSLQWPRYRVYVDGYLFSDTAIPAVLVAAQCALMMAIQLGNDPTNPIPQQLQEVKVGPINLKYMNNAAPYVISPAVNNLLSKLLQNGGNGFETGCERDQNSCGDFNIFDPWDPNGLRWRI